MDKNELNDTYQRFLTLADNKLDIDDNDLLSLVAYRLAK
jgi:2-isopropylmalate synthase